jgi:hypothetical protein
MQPHFLTPYLQTIFESIGIHSLEFVRLEGTARGPEAVARALDAADAWIERRLPQLLGTADRQTRATFLRRPPLLFYFPCGWARASVAPGQCSGRARRCCGG